MSSEETKVAVMQEQIIYIKNQVDTILTKLEEAAKSHQLQVQRMQTEMDKRFEGVHNRLELKANQLEVDKINSTISRLAWFVILAVLGALVGLVINIK